MFPYRMVLNEISRAKDAEVTPERYLQEATKSGDIRKKKIGELYQEYRAYCLRMGEYTRSTTDFYGALAQRDFERKRMTSGVVVKGLRIKSEFAG